jgi:hypothetical protein
MTDTTTTIPVFDDDKTGADHIMLTIRAGEMDSEVLISACQYLSRSRVPLTVNFNFDTPPPMFVTVTQAARILSVGNQRIESMIRTGWLRAVHYSGDEDTAKSEPPKRLKADLAVAQETGDWQGWLKRIPYDDLLAVRDYTLKHDHLPSTKVNKPGGFAGRPKRDSKKRIKVSEIAYQVVREAVDEEGRHQWMTLSDIHAAVEEIIHERRPSQRVVLQTVQSAIVGTGVKKDKFIVRRKVKGWKRSTNSQMEYRWVADPDALEERPEGYIEITEETAE